MDYTELINELKPALGDNLLAFITYGANSFTQQITRNTTENVLVVLEQINYEVLTTYRKTIVKQLKKLKLEPLVLTLETITSSADVFPIEFLDIVDDYSVLYGKDIFQGFDVDVTNLRLQCEANIKGKLIVLRQAYLKGTTEDALIKESFPLFLTTFKNITRLIRKDVPRSQEEVFACIEAGFGLDCSVFRELYELISMKRPAVQQVKERFGAYLQQLTLLAYKIDRFIVA